MLAFPSNHYKVLNGLVKAAILFSAYFVIGWFNCVDSFSQLIQLGKGSGAYPLVDREKLAYFPFLEKGEEPMRTRDLKYNYSTYSYKRTQLNHIAARNGEYNCMFLGNEDDYFHFAIYY